ncbi:putative bifunctional UDP-N-acetylglucosamine transferase and deubiquitinase ALG13 [Thalassophryne amazonica]|uniref:putative bifunctional UDP-N-acetylglucosamine transferase and deubiquitinase ALG13 n=1 Tax=Thalassophryne amazonica TaxID=390379 RepID=UPI0014722970|nr:putative bifunctional UDP-N-acetylglucosamine transferase and deubiquitinase ALG13 [Thalassophryne amazonica]
MQKGLKKYFVNMDEFLSSLGLYRKMVARDASSLFRAVSEQFVEGSFEKYLERLEDPKETVGQVEIKALSQLCRRCFVIYRFPGKPPTLISDEDFDDKVTLSCSINGHYDIVYPRSYPASAALCQSLLYELLYTQVFGLDEAELCQAMEAFRIGGRRYRNSTSVCSDIDAGYDMPEDHGLREEQEVGGASEDKSRVLTDDGKVSAETMPSSRLCLQYKVMKSLDGDVYRNLEFDVWQDTCKEMQKTDYMVFAGRQYFLGDKCQVRLEPKGKYYNAFIQEVGTHSSAVTVFIEELGEKHLVPLTDLKPVNPVPAWNVAAPPRKGDLDTEGRGQRHHRHRYFRKSRGNAGVKAAEILMPPPSSYSGSAPSALPPRFQPAGHTRPPLSPGSLTYDPYTPPHPHHPIARPPRCGASRSSARFLNRHLIGPQLTYYHPSRRYCHDYENYAFRSRRSRRQLVAALNKECQFGFPVDPAEEPTDLDGAIAYYQLDNASEAVFPPLPGAPPPPSPSSYRVQRGSGPLSPVPPPGNTPLCSSEEEPEDVSTVEDPAEYSEEYIYTPHDQSYQTSGVYSAAEPPTNQDQQDGDTSGSPQRADNYAQQLVKPLVVVCSSPSSASSSPSSSSPRAPGAAAHSQPRPVAMAIPAASPWMVNELGEPLCTVVTPPPYSYDPNGSDLPRDCRVLQYYFNLGVQWYHQSCWQQVYPVHPPEAPYPYQHYPSYVSQDPTLHVAPPLYPEAARGPHQTTSSYPESTRGADGQTDGHGPVTSLEGSSPTSSISSIPPGSAPSSALLYAEQQPLPPPSIVHLPYETPPPAAYLSSATPSFPNPAHPPHYSPYHPCLPASSHWGALQTGSQGPGPHPRVYCPAPNPTHIVSYITAPPTHLATHYIPPSV